MNALLVKMSSLGDIVHTLPAVQDAAARGVRFDWVVEEQYRDLPERASGVDRVVPVALRCWRRAPLTHRRAIGAFHRRLRARRYDLVLDAQGLLKSAVVTRWANGGARAGFDASGARERAASLCYDRRLRVPRRSHAITRSRSLFAAAFGYSPPRSAPRFGLSPASAVGRDVVLAHGATWHNKLWSEAHWVAIARRCAAAGYRPLVPWLEHERPRARRIVAAVPEARLCEPAGLSALLDVVARARGVIGVDSGLTHFAAAVGRPTVMVFGPTDPRRTGCRGARARNLAPLAPCAPCLARRCRYARSTAGVANGAAVANDAAACVASVRAEDAWVALTALMSAS